MNKVEEILKKQVDTNKLKLGLYRSIEAILLNQDGAIVDTIWMHGRTSETLLEHLQGLLVELGENVDDVLTFCEELVESEMTEERSGCE